MKKTGQGKVPREFLDEVVFASLGADSESVIVRPGHGLDNAVVSLGKSVLIVTTDPLSVIPSIGTKESAWLSVHLLATDLATSGVEPQFAAFDMNLPPEMKLGSIASYVRAVGEECRKLGITIVGGHTGRYPGGGFTVVGGGTMFSVAERSGYVTPAMAQPGDAILVTKGAAIGATAVLANSFPSVIRKKAGEKTLRMARARLHDCSGVKDAKAAAAVGLHTSVTSMHDATEGGVLGGLSELSSACGRPVIVDRESIPVSEEALAVCRVFGLDPLTALSEGTLIVTCKPAAVDAVVASLSREAIHCSRVGRVGEGTRSPGLFLSSRGSTPKPCVPGRDRYWEAYSRGVKMGWT